MTESMSKKMIKKGLVHIFSLRVPVGLPDVGHYPELFVALLESGTWTLEELSKLAGLNFLRVLKEVEQVRSIRNTVENFLEAMF